MQPETKYAKSGAYHIAYQVVGDGPIDLVLAPGFISNVEGAWNNPLQAQLFTRLASFTRLIRFDKRGTGLSDPVSVKELPTLEERMGEVRAGLHTGECELLADDIGGIAVHVAARVAAKAGPGEVLVSRTVKDLVAGSGIRFKDHGRHVLKGVPGKFALYAALAA